MGAVVIDIRTSPAPRGITLPTGLSPSAPCKPTEKGLDPWSEIAAAYTMIQDLNGIESGEVEGPSLRDFSLRFEWGKNGRNKVSKLADKLGIEYRFDNAKKLVLWTQRNQLHNQQTQQKCGFASRNATSSTTSPEKKAENNPAQPAPQPVNPTKMRVCGAQRNQLHNQPREKGRKQPSATSSTTSKPNKNAGLRGATQPAPQPASRTRAGHVHAHAHVEKSKKILLHEHEHVCVEFSLEEQRVFDIVAENFLRVGEKIPPAFVRGWFDLLGVDRFVYLWDSIRVSNYDQELRKPVRYIGAAVKAAKEGGWRWAVSRNHEIPQQNLNFLWMDAIGEDRSALPKGKPTVSARLAQFAERAGIEHGWVEGVIERVGLTPGARSEILQKMISMGTVSPADLAEEKALQLEDCEGIFSGLDDPHLEVVAIDEILRGFGFPSL